MQMAKPSAFFIAAIPLSEYQLEFISSLFRNLVFLIKPRAAGMRAYTTHCEVDAEADKIILG